MGLPNIRRSDRGTADNLVRFVDELVFRAGKTVEIAAARSLVALPELEEECRALAARCAAEDPVADPTVGFDRPANLYLVTEFSRAGGHRTLLESYIRARPHERHVVVFSGARVMHLQENMAQITDFGAFTVAPNPDLCQYDRLRWLRHRLAALAPKRVFLFHHPDDVLATVAAYELSPRFGRRLYVVRHSDTVPTLGALIPTATHVAIRREYAEIARAAHPGLTYAVLPLAHNAERSSKRLIEEGPYFGGLLSTATAGRPQKFVFEGEHAFGRVVAGVLTASGGRHLHLGPFNAEMVQTTYAELDAAGVGRDRMIFLGEVASIARALEEHKIDLFVSSFPIGGGLSVAEAASVARPIAVFDPGHANPMDRYMSGVGHRPSRAIVWSRLVELQSAVAAQLSVESLTDLATAAATWYDRRLSFARFKRRLAAVLAATEGRRAQRTERSFQHILDTIFDPDFYCRQYPDIVAAKVDPREHFASWGSAELRKPCALFDPVFYLSQLDQASQVRAANNPLFHYAFYGERAGLRPHPMFDPTLASSGRSASDATDEPASVLASYLRSKRSRLRPHTFFDESHYARERGYANTSHRPLLSDFVEFGLGIGVSPHPLIHFGAFQNPSQDFIGWLSKSEPSPGEPSPHPMFDPSHFSSGDVRAFRFGAPNLLWAHLIEGNTPGHDPHLFVSLTYIDRSHPMTWSGGPTAVELLATGGFRGDTHPLIQTNYITKQAPWVETGNAHSTQYFMQYGVSHNVDPHPYFSIQYYLFNNPDVAANGINPLTHYIVAGQFEGRSPHPFLDGRFYLESWRADDGKIGPMADYLASEAGAFRPVQPLPEALAAGAERMAKRLFRWGDDTGGAELLRDSIHPPTAPDHPSLICEVRELACEVTPDIEVTASSAAHVPRPAVVHPGHIAPSSGTYSVAALTASRLDAAVIVGGNDGVVLADGRWHDPTFLTFDVQRHKLKTLSACCDVDDQLTRVLLRRHSHHNDIKSGIHGCGTYSSNYFHFLIEVLPRILAADKLAPEDTPIITDALMPAAHFQVLRTLFPHRSVRKISQGFSYKIDTLYIGNAPQTIHDLKPDTEASHDDVRFHPGIMAHISALGRNFARHDRLRKIFLRRDGKIRRLLNIDEIESTLIDRGFISIKCQDFSFAEQVRIFLSAEEIVGPTGAHFANLMFSHPGARAYPLYSNAPGTNYYMWPGLGATTGVDVTNIVGWRVVGSNRRNLDKVHEDYRIPLNLVMPFFPRPVQPDAEAGHEAVNLHDVLTTLYQANAEADTITAAWTVVGADTPSDFNRRLARARATAGRLLANAEAAEVTRALEHIFFVDLGRNLRSGLPALDMYSTDEQQLIADVKRKYLVWADDEARPARLDAEGRAAVERLLALAMLYLRAFEMPLPRTLAGLPKTLLQRLMVWLSTPPFLFKDGDDAAYTRFAADYLRWLEKQFRDTNDEHARAILYRTVTDLDFGQLLLVDAPLTAVNAARNALLDRLTPDDATRRAHPRRRHGSEGRIRLGVLCRTFQKGPDSEAIVAFFRGFDKSRFEIYGYSVGFRDRVVSADTVFEAELAATIDHLRTLPSDPYEMRRSFLEDDLDVFFLANATNFGVRAQELALYRRVAPLQFVLNSHLPMPPGFPSFDGYITGRSDDPAFELSQTDFSEALISAPGPVICYLNSLKPRAKPLFDRAALGLTDDDVVLMNAGSLSKLRRECLQTMLEALKMVRSGKLLLAPYNPGWVARSQAFCFNHQLAEMAEHVGVDRDRIVVMGELSVAEAETALSLCDIYLNPFPHGGATMTHLALINGKPPVTLRRRSTRSIDQFLIQSVGLTELLAESPRAYKEIVYRLAENSRLCDRLAGRMRRAVEHSPFVRNLEYSLDMQTLVTKALGAMNPLVAGE